MLSRTVSDPERHSVLGDAPQCTVTENAAVNELTLLGSQGVVLDRHEHFVADAKLTRFSLTRRGEDDVVRRAGELSPAGRTAGLDLELPELVRRAVVEVGDDS